MIPEDRAGVKHGRTGTRAGDRDSSLEHLLEEPLLLLFPRLLDELQLLQRGLVAGVIFRALLNSASARFRSPSSSRMVPFRE